MKKAGIIGGSGYTGGELIRIILNHPKIKLEFVYSSTRAGSLLSEKHNDLLGVTDIKFTDVINESVDIVFLCLGHGNSKTFLKNNNFSKKTIIIDLSNDFRLNNDNEFSNKHFTYGLPEFQKSKIKKSTNIANPGCFATSIQLALLPLSNKNMIQNSVHVNSITGTTGAGVGLSDTSHFSWRNNNISWYKAFNHQHLDEIKETLNSFQNKKIEIYFIPQRGNFTRGIFTTCYTNFDGTINEAKELYSNYYKDHPFTTISENEISLKQVINTNNCFIHLYKYEGLLLITSIIDNLIKGASGQAIQNVNLIMGWNENLGLNLKGSIF